MMLLLIAGGMTNNTWATKVTYHILTLPINPSYYDYNMRDVITDKRLEAFKVTVDNQSALELPAHYKSPLATGFTYYSVSDPNITKSASAVQLFQDNTKIKGYTYEIGGSATPVAEHTTLSGSSAEYYVVYTYNEAANDGSIAKLDGSVRYNIRTKYKDKGTYKDKGFLVLNRGRNNRPALLPTDNVDPEMLASEDFMVAPVTGTGVGTYWQSNDNKNSRDSTESKFFFIFHFEGKDPYNIILRTSYQRPYTYIEKNDGTTNFVYKWYKESSLFAVSAGNNCYIASDEHKLYTTAWVSGNPNPTNPAYDVKKGNYHGQTGVVWNSLALLNNSDNNGYVFMGTRTVDGNGNINAPYYLKEKDNRNNLNFATGNSTDNLSIEGIYPIEKVTFKVATSFYDPLSPSAHIISVEDQVSKYTVDNDPIETKYLPAALKRKYCNFNGKFYKDPRCREEDEITKFSQATKHPTEGYQVYVGYDKMPDAPTFLSPSASYTTATWYELTDAGSTQEYGRKIKNNSGTYKNNGANGEYVKESEFALVGDPYEVKVLYRKGTEEAGSNTYVTLSTYDSWDIPDDDTEGSFLLRKYNDKGYWSWNPGQESVAVTYGSSSSPSVGKDAQTITINLSGLNGSKYYKITTGGAGVSQIVSVNPRVGYVYQETATTATVAVSLAANTSGADKTMTVTIQEYNDNEGSSASGSPSVITITQGTASSAFAGNEVTYSTTNSTRVKVLTLPTRTYTYKIVDKSGRIAVTASAEQTIFSKLSTASIPSIIVSPFILDETVTFYDTYTDGSGRATLVGHEITETPDVNQDIFVKYTTTNLDKKPINLSEDQEFNVVLNGEYLYCEKVESVVVVKSKASPSDSEKTSPAYLWKLRNRDPYAMLIDNMGARADLSVTGSESVTIYYNDDGGSRTESRQKGAWVKLAAALGNDVALAFDIDRTHAQQFVAKSGLQAGIYEVMVAAGTGTDASTNYYHIGRTSTTDIKIYDKAHYAHGNSVLKFQLEQTIDYKYYLIDKYDHILLDQTSHSPDLVLPAEYQSPLVATYHYYDIEQFNIDGDVYTLKATPKELTKMSDLDAEFTRTGPSSDYSSEWEAGGKLTASSVDDMEAKAKKITSTGHFYYRIGDTSDYYDVNVTKPFYKSIYVTYDINDRVKYNDKASPYMLKFLHPHAGGYYLEDGNDKLTSGKIEAVYPYCNGDGSLNIYGEDMQKEQFHGGASTRPRWTWFFESEKKDPYHVMLHSNNTIEYKGVKHYTYLQTYALDFVQGATIPQKVVTCGTLPSIGSEDITEYMVLGTEGQFRLRTTNEINDGTSNVRRDVTTLEQYWKTYNMIKLCVLGIDKSTDAYSTDESTWVVPTTDDPSTVADESTYRATLAERDWHSYAIYANAVRWNGYNDKSDGHEKKVVEKLEHWFQTFDMGDGSFDIESATIPPVLVLLDLHGWEIMRLPLPAENYPEGDDELAALRAYDSPMVNEYKFYSNATKASGCHKYSLRMQNGAERDQIKVNGVHYTSSSLGDLPPITASGVKSNGAFNDQYVTYTVKEEYEKSYDYTFNKIDATHYSETETPSKFLMVQHGRFYKIENNANPSYISKPVEQHTNPNGGNVYDMILNPTNHAGNPDILDGSGNWKGNCFWYIKPNQNIDKEMGIKYATETGNTGEPWTEVETKEYYYEHGKAGFDPYNLQIQLLKNNDKEDDLRYLTSHMTSTRLDNGIMIGDYTGSGGMTNMTLVAGHDYSSWNPLTPTSSEGYDHTNLTISNQTFMAVSDANGNMQLMPRFDHTKRIDLDGVSPWETKLEDPVDHPKASAADNASMGSQTTFFVRPQIFEYKIINNSGKESLRYKRGGDYYPAITDHFKSPLAKDFTYYTGLADFESPVEITAEDWGPKPAEFKRSASTVTQMDSLLNLLPTSGTYYYRTGTRGVFRYWQIKVNKGLLEREITGSFADEGLNNDDCNVIVRYNYDTDADHDADRILEGKWFTTKLNNKDMKCGDTDVINTSDGTGVSLLEGTSKPDPVDEDDKTWQWKFLAAPTDPSSDYYVAPDPYDVQVFSRKGNYTTNPTAEPSPMAVGIKVPNEVAGADHFALLSHSEGGYALAVAGSGAYTYDFVYGNSMTTSVGATTATETSFTQKAGIFDGVKSQLLVNDDVQHNFEYKVINNSSKYAVSATQDNDGAEAHEFVPYLPEGAQTPLLNMEDYKYYGFANYVGATDTYNVIPQTILYTLYGLYDDVVWVRYGDYNMNKTEYQVPNEKTIVEGHVARGAGSHDASMNIDGGLPYNIIWYNDNMMSTATDDATTISDGGSQDLSGLKKNVWYIEGNDPYALKIRHKESSNYVNGTATLVAAAADAKEFMLLKKSGYDYGILQETGGTNKLSEYGQTMVAGDPTKFIIFGLSVHDLIYRLIIAKTCTKAEETDPDLDPSKYVDIPYRETESGTETTKRIFGSTQRDLVSQVSGVPGDKYQLGTTLTWGGSSHTYCHDAGTVSIGDVLKVPNVFNRPNCTFEYYIQDIYGSDKTTEQEALNNKYKGLKLDNLMSDAELIDKTVIVNVVYSFDKNVATNTGLDFVRSVDQNLWYTYETRNGDTPYLAHYTNAWGLQSMEGRDTRYTNDYLWTPLGDVYGFMMYNRYMIKNSDGSDKVMTFDGTASEGKNLAVAKPGTTVDAKTYTKGNEIFELITGDMDGYFRVHPVVNTGSPTYYVRRDPEDENYLKLSTTTCDWTFGLDMSLLEPYYERAGYVGGLTAEGKTAYETAVATGMVTEIQKVVYDDDNIIPFTKGYYRLHSVPGTPGVDPVRYASGYLHEIEKTAGTSSTPIPMHFYSKVKVTGTFNGETGPLGSGYTETPATRGDVPVPATEDDPSTIFYLDGEINPSDPADGVNPRVFISTQGLYIKGNAADDDHGSPVMTATSGEATKFSLIGIGGTVFLIANELTPATRKYLHYGQDANIYDLKYYHNSPTNEARWCIEPANNKGLNVKINNGGEHYYYSTFYAPYDVKLPDNGGGKTYYAYICDKWDDKNLHPKKVPAVTGTPSYAEGKFVPAGTPVIIRTNDERDSVALTIEGNIPSAPLPSSSNVFIGKYLEQLLPLDAGGHWTQDVYTLGLPFISDINKDGDYDDTGDIYAPLPAQASSGVGFYINATANKENNQSKSRWDKNNRYVLHNKIYYRADVDPGAREALTRNAVNFVPLIFGDELIEQPDVQPDEEGLEESLESVDNQPIFDLAGRRLSEKPQKGFYIQGGKKFFVR